MESILISIKKMLGITSEYQHFDPELIIYINSVFTTLAQLGVGSTTPFKITSSKETWNEFLPDGDLESVKTYVYLKVRLIFDPPTSSYVQQAYQDQIRELEWRMNVTAEIDWKDGEAL